LILTAHQPVYIPWLGLFHKIALADLFCYFDIVQYQKRDYNNRNLIKTINGGLWLSVPVDSKNHFKKNVSTIHIIQNVWVKKHLKSIEYSYKNAPYYNMYFSELEETIQNNSKDTLGLLNLSILKLLMKFLNIKTPIIKASDYDFSGDNSDLVLEMCLYLKADTYIFGKQGAQYADVDMFKSKGISIYFQNYNHPVYTQNNGDFLPYMSVIDLLFNEGPRSYEIIMSGNDAEILK